MNKKLRDIEIRDGVLFINCCSCGMMLPAEESFRKTKSGKSYMSECIDCVRHRDRVYAVYRLAKKRGVSVQEIMDERAIAAARNAKRAEESAEAKSIIGKLVGANPANRANICFDCQNACGGCSWTAVDDTRRDKPVRFEPVPGWTATPVFRTVSKQIIKTYAITACPQFVPDRREK